MTGDAEAALLAIIAERPGDADARLVYADWLEGQADERATVVRLHHQLTTLVETLAFEDPALLACSRELIERGHGMMPSWLALLGHPPLARTSWGTRTHHGDPYLLALRVGGVLAYRQNDYSASPGTWMQIGNAVAFQINGYSPHEGVLVGDRMRGLGCNQDGNSWTWEICRLADDVYDTPGVPELPPQPRDHDFLDGTLASEWKLRLRV
ncbi:MAG: TIGR02996 domain-containing protein [Deltaproteobacteria bacterium]|nr:TIGR02996 domain-containing protein [Deltaproteobacteria bacterium]